MKRLMAGLVAGFAFVALTASTAQAQSAEIGGSFALQKWNSSWGDSARGVAVDFAKTVRRSGNSAIAVVADVSRTRFSGEETDTGFVGGVRFKFRTRETVSFFVQGTGGLVHWAEDDFGFGAFSGNDYVVGGGAGVQVKVNDRIDVKPIQFDLWLTPKYKGEYVARLAFGVVYKIGK